MSLVSHSGRVDSFGRDRYVVKLQLRHHLLDGSEAIALIGDGEPAVEPHERRVGPQESRAEGVERPDPNPCDGRDRLPP